MIDPELTLRVAVPGDAEALCAIYAPYVLETAISFEYEVPSAAEFSRRIAQTLQKYPYLVAQRGCEILGYAYTGAYAARAAYAHSATASIYIRQDCRRAGIGRALYRALEDVSRAQNIHHLYACISSTDGGDAHLNGDSPLFHQHMGYALTGSFRHCGCKFGAWYDTVWMEKQLLPDDGEPLPLIPFPALPAETVDRCLRTADPAAEARKEAPR